MEHSTDRLIMQLKFMNPDQISSSVYGRDKLIIKVVSLDPFISAETGLSLTSADFPNGLPQLVKELPPIVNEETQKQLSSSTKNVGASVNTVGAGNLVINVLMNGSMQQLFGMIRVIQVIILTALMNIVFPPNAAAFFQGAISFATMDVLSGEEIYKKIF